jgi:MerR family transcriptional regulator, light-induced transcriptional regulator
MERKPEDSPGGPRDNVVAMKPYAIGTAARLAGIPPETLRIWERRYQLLDPGRTVGGHRLYSEDDVELLRAVRRLVDSGMRIGGVARMGHEAILREVEKLGPEAAADKPAKSSLIDDIIHSGRDLDPSRVGPLLDRPLLMMGGDEAVLSVYLPLLAKVGELWHSGQLSIAVEHFIEKLVTSRVHAILQSMPQPHGGRLAICASLPGERHEFGILAASVMLKRAGFLVSHLGGDLPAMELEGAVRRLAPSLVVLSATNELSSDAKGDIPIVLQRRPMLDVPLIMGGSSSPSLSALLQRPHSVIERLDDLATVALRIAR